MRININNELPSLVTSIHDPKRSQICHIKARYYIDNMGNLWVERGKSELPN